MFCFLINAFAPGTKFSCPLAQITPTESLPLPPPPKPPPAVIFCDDLLHVAIANYLPSTSPLRIWTNAIVQEGIERGVDPRTYVAIANAESSLGRSPQSRATNNPFGLLTPRNGRYVYINFSSLASAIHSVGTTVDSYISRGVDTIAELYSGIPNSGYWVGPRCAEGLRNATSAMTQMGGNPNDLSLPQSVGGIDCVYRRDYVASHP